VSGIAPTILQVSAQSRRAQSMGAPLTNDNTLRVPDSRAYAATSSQGCSEQRSERP
jgi:hypothetical protein